MSVDDVMNVVVDGIQHSYQRDGTTVTYVCSKERSKKPIHTLERTYKSVHAAVCAFGRLRSEPEFRTSWRESVEIANIRERHRKNKKKTKPFLTMEVIALSLLGETDEERQKALDAIIPPLKDRFLAGHNLLTGSTPVRQRLHSENVLLASEKPKE